MKKIICSILLIVVLALQSFAVNDSDIGSMGSFILDTVTEPSVGSVGGEWAVLGLARSGIDVPGDYFESSAETSTSYPLYFA